MSAALANIRVLDLSRVLAGPWAGQTLADLGAEVIKIEKPGSGDDTRRWGPPFLKDKDGNDSSESAYFQCANRNKQSLTLDLRQSTGQELLRELVKQSDVLIENFKVGSLARFGLDYESLKTLNPKLIFCSVTGFGQSGPAASQPGYDFLIQGLGGLMSLTGHADDEEGSGPMKVGVALTDILTGLYATVGILAALNAREKTGLGQYIDLALLDVQVACLANQAMNYLTSGEIPERLGNAHPNIVPYQDFPSADGYFILAIGNDAQFNRFCLAAGLSDLADDPRFVTNALRVENRAALIPLLRQATVFKTSKQWIELLEEAGVPCGPINSLPEVFSNAQVQTRGLLLEIPNSIDSLTPQVASPLRLSATPVQYRSAPPLLGEHSDSVLRRLLKLSTETISDLRKAKVI